MLIHIAGHPLTLLCLAFGPTPPPPLPTLPPILAEKAAQAQAATARIGDIARWNDALHRAGRWRPSISPSRATTARRG